jgi:hypothetical protein
VGVLVATAWPVVGATGGGCAASVVVVALWGVAVLLLAAPMLTSGALPLLVPRRQCSPLTSTPPDLNTLDGLRRWSSSSGTPWSCSIGSCEWMAMPSRT